MDLNFQPVMLYHMWQMAGRRLHPLHRRFVSFLLMKIEQQSEREVIENT